MQASTAQTDVEVNSERTPKRPRNIGGYPRLAAWIARDPDNETFIFRKFDELSAKNLMNMQNDLSRIEDELKVAEDQVWASKNVEAIRGLANWELSQERVKEQKAREPNLTKQDELKPENMERRKAKLEKELKVKLKEYHKALLLQAKICRLDRPSKEAQEAFRSKLKGSAPIVFGRAQNLLDEQKDVVSLRPTLDTDPVSRFLRAHWPGPGESDTDDPGDQTEHFPESKVKFTVAIINLIAAMIILIASIFSLYYVSRPKVKLALIGIFTILFATSIGFLTSAKRQEIFAACAAYTAVLVVFVSGDLKKC
ncbi:hypothetical protein BDV96DRAFT_587427 [Lophiotrema nucula]|uniref:DUF6594 domain-containing protein n=1 Tax=Lophiotrema nucula TaxID=690887 RepID=A0A6A5YQY4_9PLEO|nr:hypothetical protein BDV96DRAFT_587427 [Lophiotrema nucula]